MSRFYKFLYTEYSFLTLYYTKAILISFMTMGLYAYHYSIKASYLIL